MAEPPEGSDVAPTAELIIEAAQVHTAMIAAMQDLPPGQRHGVVAHDLDEETMGEIVARLGVPRSTLYKWRARGLAALVKAVRPLRG